MFESNKILMIRLNRYNVMYNSLTGNQFKEWAGIWAFAARVSLYATNLV